MTARLAIGFALVAAACTGDITSGGDDDIDPPVVEVSITVRDQGVPAPNITIVFQAPDGTLIADLKTDGGGVAKADMPDGGSVSVIRSVLVEEIERQVVYTYVGVKPLDNLVFGRGTLLDPAEVNVTVNVPPDAGNVTIKTPCGQGAGAAPTVTLTLTGCATELDFFVENAAGDGFLARAPVAGLVDFTAQVFQPKNTTMLSLTAVPVDIQTTSIQKRLDTPAPFSVFSTGALSTRTTIEATTPTLPTSEQVVIVTAVQGTSAQMISNRQPFSATPSAIDVNAGLIVRTSATAVDPATGNVTWLEVGEGAPDFVTAMLVTTRGEQTFTRHVAAPYAGALLLVPPLPDPYLGLNWLAGDIVAANHQLVRATGGYDAMRGRLFAVGSTIDAAPMNGTTTVSYEIIEP
jgi:hypothetical protein